jgi:signal transduction histidine kinase
LVAGVAAGLAAHSRVPVWLIRVGFLVTSLWKFSGAIAYAFLWLLLARYEPERPIGLVAAERQGLRKVATPNPWLRILGWPGAFLACLAAALVIRAYDGSWIGQYAIHILVVGFAIAGVWGVKETQWPGVAKALVAVVGILLAWIVGAFLQARLWDLIAPYISVPYQSYFAAFVITGTAVVGGTVLLLPWLMHPPRSEAAKQAALIAETRAAFAAHLHDSVLQTLAIIQKRAGDPREVAQLARRQEKELREWLYAERTDDETATSAMKEVVAEVEASYPIAVELICVGDREMTVEIDAVIRAAREAIHNAAKHSGADKIDVYLETQASQVEAYVRDRGHGFNIEDIGDDRMGIRGSIIERLTRYGGKVEIRSTPGEGTEIHLLMPLDEEGVNHD